VKLGPLPHDHQFEFQVRTVKDVRRAKKLESELVSAYELWLSKTQRELGCLTFGRIRCDAFEKERRNLLEAKASGKREYIRMAVGQLLDYGFLARNEFPNPNLAVLLPKKPTGDILRWLSSCKISVVWRQKGGRFSDNANRQFC
jgi:hypothetical protein